MILKRSILFTEKGYNYMYLNKIATVYSLEYTNISKMVFTNHVGRSCTNMIKGHCCVVDHLAQM
jgi:hypothetical protein